MLFKLKSMLRLLCHTLIKSCLPFATSIHFFIKNTPKFHTFSAQVPPKWMPKSPLSASNPPQRVNLSNFSFQNDKKSKNVHANWKKYPQVAKKNSKTPHRTLPKPPQNPSRIPSKMQLKKTQFLTPFLFLAWDARNIKNAAPVEAKRYILQN